VDKVFCLVPVELQLRIKVLARENQVPESWVATCVLLEGLRLFEDAKLDLSGFLHHSEARPGPLR